MKKIRPLALGLMLSAFLGSCTLSHTVIVTNNPVGSKTGSMKSGTADADAGVTYSQTMKNGRISKAGVAEYKLKNYVFIMKEYMVVTGE